MFGKRLTKDELGELQAMERLIREQKYLVQLVEGNTLVVPQHQAFVNQHKAIIQLLENDRENYVSKCAHRLGFTGPISLDMASGKLWSRS